MGVMGKLINIIMIVNYYKGVLCFLKNSWNKFKNARTSIHLFVLACLFIMIIVLISIICNVYKDGFLQNILVEIHGAIIDSIIIGSLVMFLNVRSEKRIQITTLKENIEFFKTIGTSYSSLKTLVDCKKLLNYKCKPDLSSSKFFEIKIRKMNFTDYYLFGLNIFKCVIDEIDFRYSDMRYSIFTNSRFFNCDFRGVQLNDSKFINCFLSGCSFHSTCLERITFENVEFESIDFTDAILINVDFVNCKFQDTTFQSAVLNNTKLPEKLGGRKIKKTKGEFIKHKPCEDYFMNKAINLKFKSKIACSLNEMIHDSSNRI
jgi:hypothetical protein